MSGSVKRDSERGSWFFVVDVPGLDGKRRQMFRRGFATKREASKELAAIVAASARGTLVVPTRSTLAAFVTTSWLPMIGQRVRPTTFDGYRRNLSNHILPALGGISLGQLNRATVATWVSELSGSGLAPKSVRNIVGVLTKVLDDACELGLLATNPAQRLRNLPQAPSPRPRAWTLAQVQRFIAHVRDERWYPLWRFLAVTGVRRGEALGLRWDAVDLDAGTVTICHQRSIAGGSVVEGQPKTSAGARTIALDATMIAALRAWRRQCNEERLVMGAGWQGDGWVFCWPDGSPIWPQKPTAWFRQHCRTLGLPEIGIHGLRHTAATWMVARGESPKLVQQRLGHSHVSVTLGLYSHVQPGHDQAVADAFGAALDGGS